MRPGPEQEDTARPNHFEVGFEIGLAAARIFVVVPVIVLVASALGAFAYGTDVFVQSIRHIVDRPFPVRSNIGLFLVVIDLFLIGATLLIAAIGFYELFVSRIDVRGSLTKIPGWLEMRDVNDLKARVIAMIVLVSAVSFVEVLVDNSSSGLRVLELGAAVAFTIGALTAFLRLSGRSHDLG